MVELCLPKATVWVRFPSSAPKEITENHNDGNRKGGKENSPVDYFPDAAWISSSAPKKITENYNDGNRTHYI